MTEKKLEKRAELAEKQDLPESGRTNGPDAESLAGQPVSETWAEETIADLDDFIESQGIYIRQ